MRMKPFKLNNIYFLLLFIVVFMFLGAGKAFDNKITHPSPTGFMASDAFTHNWVAQNTYDTGYINQPSPYAFENEQEYTSKLNNYNLFHPPILPLLTASFSKLSGLNVYDANIILVFCFISLIICLSYFILAKFNENLALFSLPLTLLFLQRKFFISLSWGWWDFITGEFFLFAIFLLILNDYFKKRYIFNAILITLAFMSHGVEAMYAAIFIFLTLIYNLFLERKKISSLLLEQIKSIFLVMLIGIYSITLFLKTMGAMGYHQFKIMSYNYFISHDYGGIPANYFIYFSEFINFEFLIILGCLILAYFLIKNKSNIISYYLFVIFMSFTPYLYFTAGERGLQWRFLWPIYLSFSIGVVGYLIYILLKKILRSAILLKTMIFLIILITIIVIIYPLNFIGSGLLDSTDYESYEWIHENTNIYADVLILFSPINDQISRLYLLKRDIFISTLESWNNFNINNSNLINLKDNNLLQLCFAEKEDISLFKKSHFIDKQKEANNYYFKNLSICYFDYIYLPLKNQQEIHNKNIYYLENLVKRNISQIVFSNQGGAIIAKNIVKGEECERRFRSQT